MEQNMFLPRSIFYQLISILLFLTPSINGDDQQPERPKIKIENHSTQLTDDLCTQPTLTDLLAVFSKCSKQLLFKQEKDSCAKLVKQFTTYKKRFNKKTDPAKEYVSLKNKAAK